MVTTQAGNEQNKSTNRHGLCFSDSDAVKSDEVVIIFVLNHTSEYHDTHTEWHWLLALWRLWNKRAKQKKKDCASLANRY